MKLCLQNTCVEQPISLLILQPRCGSSIQRCNLDAHLCFLPPRSIGPRFRAVQAGKYGLWAGPLAGCRISKVRGRPKNAQLSPFFFRLKKQISPAPRYLKEAPNGFSKARKGHTWPPCLESRVTNLSLSALAKRVFGLGPKPPLTCIEPTNLLPKPRQELHSALDV